MRQYVIIGGGIAAVGCIEGIRSMDTGGKIILISGERRLVYCRPLISYYLQGKTDLEKMKYRPDAFYTENGCEVVYAAARSIDSAARAVCLDGGRRIGYDSLCVAAGASPFVLPYPGLETVKNKFGFLTVDDALALNDALTAESEVLIMGAGLIGLKCAEGLCGRVKSVTVCNRSPRVLTSILDESCAALMQKKLEEHGVRFVLGDTAERFERNTAFLKSGRKVAFDILVLALGVRPNVSLVEDIGGACDRGILIDETMKTSIDNIYAAGDCAQGYDASTGEKRVVAIFPNAYLQGRCAGVNMAGGSQVFDKAIPMNAVGFFGLHALTAGSRTGGMYEEKTDGIVKRLYVKDGLLTGFVLMGDVAGAGVYTAMIRERIPLESLNFDMLKKLPSLAPFSAEYRGKKLGGVV